MEPRIDTVQRNAIFPYVTLYPQLLAAVEGILSDWTLSARIAPWAQLDARERQNNLADVVTRVIDCAMSDAPRLLRADGVIESALTHGVFRRRQALDVSSILSEYSLLRWAIWRGVSVLARTPDSSNAIFVIDQILSVATRASMIGYYREEFEANGRLSICTQELRHAILS